MKRLKANKAKPGSAETRSGNAFPVKRFKPKVAKVLPLKWMRLSRFAERELPTQEVLLAPWLRSQSLVMVYGPRGAGKTHAACEIGYALASGTEFLCWSASKPRKVLYLDGEMAGATMQRRLRRILKASDKADIGGENFRLVTPDLQKGLLPDLGTVEGQALIDQVITDDIDVVIIDNLSAWARTGGEDAEGWAAIATWALRKRAEGKSVIFVHHAGKSGKQRGTSKREDLLDVVIRVAPPSGYKPEQGARFQISFDKARELHGDGVRPILAKLGKDAGGKREWNWSHIDGTSARHKQILKRYKAGEKPAAIARALKVARSTVSRVIARAKQEGHLKDAK